MARSCLGIPTGALAFLTCFFYFELSAAAPEKPAPPSPEAAAFFESKVRPVLIENCHKCHGANKQKGGLRLDSRAALLAGGDQGAVIVPGHPEKSLLIQAVGHATELKMPPSKKLPREQIADLTRWVSLGAPWPGEDKDTAVAPRKGELQVTDKDRAHWAFQPIRRPAVPAVKNPAWPANPIDAFILAKLEAKGLRPNPPADKRALVRRLYYDLTGLPPTPAEVEAFVNDPAANAYETLVDRLLDSPRYGEKWGRHWLDLVRYAETNSYERDNPKPHAWRYRDYVIRSFNNDKPFDRFAREQLAGDELPDADADAIIATGYYRLGIWDDEPSDAVQSRYDGLDDILATTGQVFLGLTFDCARCHDHKIDPVPQKDYYRLQAFFHNINHFRNGGGTDEAEVVSGAGGKESLQQQIRELEKRRGETQSALAAIDKEFRGRYQQKTPDKKDVDFAKLLKSEGPELLGPERYAEYQRLQRELEALKKQKIATAKVLCVTEAGRKPPETFVHLRGNPHVKGDKVEPAFPLIFAVPAPVIPEPPANAKTTGRRRVLADWIVSKDNPLTPRVLANRVWQFHFGRGLVRSSSNFGTQGDRPTHPELLDWLASELIDRGWRLKPIHRLILASNAYRMSSRGDAKALKRDPTNDLCWRFDMRRLSAEEIRDSILTATGTLNLKMYGPGIYPEIPKEVLAGQSVPGRGWGKSPPEEQNRRSVYIHVKRSLLTPILESFDVAESDRSSPMRHATTQPTQALALLNSVFLNKEAGLFADRLHKEAGADAAKQVRLALQLATTRPPSADEVQRGVDLIETLKAKDGVPPDAALKIFCLLVLNLNEFVYLD